MAKVGWSVAVVGALVLGIFVANTSWRSRKQIWLIQGALIGGSAGFIAGRLTSKKRISSKPEHPQLEIHN